MRPDFSLRADIPEIMDDLDVSGDDLEATLVGLLRVNRLLGGHAASRRAIRPFMDRPLHVLDLGCGLADHAVDLVRMGARAGCDLRVTAVDANPNVTEAAKRHVTGHLPSDLRSRVDVLTADALALPLGDDSVDVVLSAMFLHHFADAEAVTLLRECGRVARRGVVVNDLERSRLGYAGIRAICALLPVPRMFAHDGPVSVRRAFSRDDLAGLFADAGLPRADIRWRWAFRWTAVSRLDA